MFNKVWILFQDPRLNGMCANASICNTHQLAEMAEYCNLSMN